MRKLLWCLPLAVMAAASCDDSTESLGMDVMPSNDKVTAQAEVYTLSTTTVKAGAVLANTGTCYLGSVTDPELGVRTTSDFLAQFHLPEFFMLPEKDKIVKDADGQPAADSLQIVVYFDTYYGDSLTTMKLRVRDLDAAHTLTEGEHYYSDLTPASFVSPTPSVDKTLAYAVKDFTRADEVTNGTSYYRNVVIKLPKSYADKVVRAYYDNPSSFTSSYSFIHNVCPGFYIEHAGGQGAMITAKMMAMNLYFSYHTESSTGTDSIADGYQRLGATDEVLQCTRTASDYPDALSEDKLASLPYTLVKSPAGLFTEVTLPVSDIIDGTDGSGTHYNDSVNQAQLTLRSYNSTASAYSIPAPSTLLLVRKAKMKDFFENDNLPDSRESYIASYTSAYGVYTFSNIAQLVTTLKNERDKGAGVLVSDTPQERKAKYAVWEAANPDWNKALLVPVQADYSTSTSSSGSSTKTLSRLRHEMGLYSAKLQGGKDVKIDMSVIYGRFNH